jgi:hypothetical protein
MEWQSLSAFSQVDVVVIRTESCLKCAGLLCGTGCCFAELSFGSCKKLEVLITGPMFVNQIVLLGIFGLLRESKNECIATCGMKGKDPHKKRDECKICSLIHFCQRLAICHSLQMVS